MARAAPGSTPQMQLFAEAARSAEMVCIHYERELIYAILVLCEDLWQ
ncbi:unnamed protein product [Rhodiola kirilowii]